MARFIGIFGFLSLLLVMWCSYELNFFDLNQTFASDKVNEPIEKLQKSIRERELAIEKRERELATLEKEMKQREELLLSQISSYEKIVGELKEKLQKLEKKNEEKKDDFLKIYEKMDPKQSANILSEMEPKIAASILKKLSVNIAAEILSKMAGEKAKKVTEVFINGQ